MRPPRLLRLTIGWIEPRAAKKRPWTSQNPLRGDAVIPQPSTFSHAEREVENCLIFLLGQGNRLNFNSVKEKKHEQDLNDTGSAVTLLRTDDRSIHRGQGRWRRGRNWRWRLSPRGRDRRAALLSP